MVSYKVRIGLLMIVLTCAPVFADLNVTSWELRSGFVLPSLQFQTITNVSNPLNATTRRQLTSNVSQADYQFAWMPQDAEGEFLTTFNHTLRVPSVHTTSSSRIRFAPTEDVYVTITGEATYSHAPGDPTSVGIHAAIYDGVTFNVLKDAEDLGGEFNQGPSSGSLALFVATVIPAGTTFEIRYALNTNNEAELPSSGVADASGFVNITIEPIPEPTTSLLLVAASTLVFRRRLRRRSR